MTAVKDAASSFLRNGRIAVTGVSRDPAGHGSNSVYARLKERGYDVFAVNPNAETIDGDPCYPDVSSIPGGVDAVVIATAPERAMATMEECAALGIGQVWMHRAFGKGSVDPQAVAWGRDHDIEVIDGGCPLMFDPTADGAHKVMKTVLTITGKVPRKV
jgi:predicted CoA-binding protein